MLKVLRATIRVPFRATSPFMLSKPNHLMSTKAKATPLERQRCVQFTQIARTFVSRRYLIPVVRKLSCEPRKTIKDRIVTASGEILEFWLLSIGVVWGIIMVVFVTAGTLFMFEFYVLERRLIKEDKKKK